MLSATHLEKFSPDFTYMYELDSYFVRLIVSLANRIQDNLIASRQIALLSEELLENSTDTEMGISWICYDVGRHVFIEVATSKSI